MNRFRLLLILSINFFCWFSYLSAMGSVIKDINELRQYAGFFMPVPQGQINSFWVKNSGIVFRPSNIGFFKDKIINLCPELLMVDSKLIPVDKLGEFRTLKSSLEPEVLQNLRLRFYNPGSFIFKSIEPQDDVSRILEFRHKIALDSCDSNIESVIKEVESFNESRLNFFYLGTLFALLKRYQKAYEMFVRAQIFSKFESDIYKEISLNMQLCIHESGCTITTRDNGKKVEPLNLDVLIDSKHASEFTKVRALYIKRNLNGRYKAQEYIDQLSNLKEVPQPVVIALRRIFEEELSTFQRSR